MANLFVVEDDEIDQRIMKYYLNLFPAFESVTYLQTGAQLIWYLEQHVNDQNKLPDIVFLDLTIPEISGLDVLDAIHKMYSKLSKKIIVYIVSSSIWSAQILKAESYYFVRKFFSKPITPNNLLSVTQELSIHN